MKNTKARTAERWAGTGRHSIRRDVVERTFRKWIETEATTESGVKKLPAPWVLRRLQAAFRAGWIAGEDHAHDKRGRGSR